MFVCLSVSFGRCCCDKVWMWVCEFVLCVVVVGRVWLLFHGIWVCGGGGSIIYGAILVGVV